MIKEKLKSLNKKEVIVICSFLLLFFVSLLINITLKNTHAFYNYESAWTPIFTSRVGNFVEEQDVEEYLEKQSNSGLETINNMNARKDTLRRYQGSNVNNYICFGTKDKNECLENQSKYMYRIMGIDTTTKQLKIIKKEALEEAIVWDSNGSSTWDAVNVQTFLNDSGFYNNINYVPIDWKTYIANHNWKYGDNTTIYDVLGTSLFATENGWTTTISKPIGLQYVSDYYLAGSNDANCFSNYTDLGICINSWIYIKNNDSNPPGTTQYSEWFMSRGYQNRGWYIKDIGKPSDESEISSQFALRPVFYIKSNIKLIGSGAKENPFMMEKLPTAGDTSTLERTTDVNLIYYVQDISKEKEYTIVSNKPVGILGYRVDEERSNCIPTSAKYSDYSIQEDGTVTFSAILSKPSQVVCRIYYSFDEKQGQDIIIYALLEDTDGSVTYEDKKYEPTNTIPTTYKYYKTECIKGALTDITYNSSTGFKAISEEPSVCYAYFNK